MKVIYSEVPKHLCHCERGKKIYAPRQKLVAPPGFLDVVFVAGKKEYAHPENQLYAMFACANLYALAMAGRKLSTT